MFSKVVHVVCIVDFCDDLCARILGTVAARVSMCAWKGEFWAEGLLSTGGLSCVEAHGSLFLVNLLALHLLSVNALKLRASIAKTACMNIARILACMRRHWDLASPSIHERG